MNLQQTMARRARWLAAVLYAGLAAAQVTPVPGTGCGNPRTVVLLPPALGQQITITNPFPCLLQTAVTAIGTAASFPWTGCAGGSCPIGLQPVAVFIGGITNNFVVQIPNNPTLVGFCFRAQSGCISPSCLSVDQAVQICVQ